MAIRDDSMKAAWQRQLAAMQKNIDQYLTTHYQLPYVEHDLDLEDTGSEEELPVQACVFTVAGSAPGKDKRGFFSAKKAVSLRGEHLSIEDFLQQQGETFSQMLLRLIDERNLKDSQVYKDANIDRRLFSKIRGDAEYIPSKKTVICFCMALQLDLSETEKLLGAAGYALSASSRSDLIIMYLLENREYNVVFANIVLEQYGESALTR